MAEPRPLFMFLCLLQVELMTAVQTIALYGYVRQGEAQEPDLSNLRNLTVCPSSHISQGSALSWWNLLFCICNSGIPWLHIARAC